MALFPGAPEGSPPAFRLQHPEDPAAVFSQSLYRGDVRAERAWPILRRIYGGFMPTGCSRSALDQAAGHQQTGLRR